VVVQHQRIELKVGYELTKVQLVQFFAGGTTLSEAVGCDSTFDEEAWRKRIQRTSSCAAKPAKAAA
jgi:hypothetical protein